MQKILLISSSRVHGSGYFEHCQQAVAKHLGSIRELLFVPHALADHDRYESIVSAAFAPLDISIQSLHRENDPKQAVASAKAIFIGGGNSFRLLRQLYELELLGPIRSTVQGGVPYIGSSAGSNLACPTIRTTNDMPIVEPTSLTSLGLIPFQINPHFIDADPNSTHKGETREQRLAEYHEENSTPVVGMREGSWLNIGDEYCRLGGTTGAKLFQQGQPPQELEPNADLSSLL